jgi:hypothetical protein
MKNPFLPPLFYEIRSAPRSALSFFLVCIFVWLTLFCSFPSRSLFPSFFVNKQGKSKEDPPMIVDVWASNLKEELNRIMEIVDDYNFVSMDTEFPGIVARPLGTFKNSHDYHYQTLKCNVDILKIIQLGLTFCDAQGKFAPGTCTWQFHFKFNLRLVREAFSLVLLLPSLVSSLRVSFTHSFSFSFSPFLCTVRISTPKIPSNF